MAQADCGVPWRLLHIDKASGKVILDPEALGKLRKISGPVAVAGILGPAREAKSTLLNLVKALLSNGNVPPSTSLAQAPGFSMSNSHDYCTKGLWLCDVPTRLSAHGTSYTLLLLDNDGLNATDQVTKTMNKLGCLTMLLSSLVLVNTMRTIDSVSIDRLSFVSEIAASIQAGAASATQGLTRSLVYVIRDACLAFQEGESADGFLEGKLAEAATPGGCTPEVAKDIREANCTRASIRQVFRPRCCVQLPHPASGGAVESTLHETAVASLPRNFLRGLVSLGDIITEAGAKAASGDQRLTGPILAGLCQASVKAINTGAVPDMATNWQSVASGICDKELYTALALYDARMDGADFPSEEQARAAHKKMCEAITKGFDIAVAPLGEVGRDSRKKLDAGLTQRLKALEAAAARNRFMSKVAELEANLKEAEAKEADAKAKEADAKAKEADAKAKEAVAKAAAETAREAEEKYKLLNVGGQFALRVAEAALCHYFHCSPSTKH